MKWWTTVRVAGPVSIGLALVLLRPTWVSVAVLGLLICVAVWLDGQERRADDVEDLEELMGAAVAKALEVADGARSSLASVEKEQKALNDVWHVHDRALTKLKEDVAETTKRLDATAQQRKGPSL